MAAKFTFSNTLMKTWLLIHQCETLQKKAEKAVLAKVGLTTQAHSILLAVENISKPVKVTAVANWLDRNPNVISMRIDQMEKEGMLTRVRDLNDHRAVSLEMTPLGKKLFDKANRLTWKLFQEFFADLNAEELQMLNVLLEKVRTKAFVIVNPEKTSSDLQTLSERTEVASLAEVSRPEIEEEEYNTGNEDE